MAKNQKNNPFKLSELKHNAIHFDWLDNELYLPAMQEAIAQAKKNVESIKRSTEAPTFFNTIEELELCSDEMELISNIFHNQLSAHTNDRLQALALEIGPLLARFSNDVMLDAELFQRIEKVYQDEKAKGTNSKLNVEEKELLEKTYSDFVRNGAKLTDDKKAQLRQIDEEMSKLAPQFSDNVLKATNAFFIHVTTESELDGLPDMMKEAASADAQARKLTGWVLTLQPPSYLPFMEHGKNRKLREQLYRAYNSRATTGELNNSHIILKTLKLREERARLLGYGSHAQFVLEKRMASDPETVRKFSMRVLDASMKAAKVEVDQVKKFAESNGGPKADDFMPWDFAFWSERLKEHLYSFSEEELRPYFEVDRVINGVFEHARRLYGLEFKQLHDIPVYHEDVKTYEVSDKKTGEYVGLFYADFYPRDTKKGGAWMTNYLSQGLLHGKLHRPHVANVCNFTKPTPDRPALLSFMEVQTLFHEFGHALHSLLSKCKYRSLAGPNVYWDFVELPSQIMENWTYEKESLDLFARHYQTGEKIPDDLAKKLKDSSNYLAGYRSVRQMTFSLLDLEYHVVPVESVRDPITFEKSFVDKIRLLPHIDGMNFSCAFSHIFAGGYSAGYYSYKWAEVLDADAFEYFKEQGIFNADVAGKFKEHVLSKGGTEHPMTLYKRFRGREPDPDALLRREGLL